MAAHVAGQTGRAGKRSPGQGVFLRRQTRLQTTFQTTLWCRCGSSRIAHRGLCPACYAREQHDQRFFAGLRAAVVARDGQLCRLCAVHSFRPAALVVHHRRPGRSRLPWLIALCRGCHARVHRLRLVRSVYPEAFLELWREQHPGAPEQLALSFVSPPALPVPQHLFEQDCG